MASHLTQAELIAEAAARFKVPPWRAKRILAFAFERIASSTWENGRFEWNGFGVWSVRDVPPRTIVSPALPNGIGVYKPKRLAFKASKRIAHAFNPRRSK